MFGPESSSVVTSEHLSVRSLTLRIRAEHIMSVALPTVLLGDANERGGISLFL